MAGLQSREGRVMIDTKPQRDRHTDLLCNLTPRVLKVDGFSQTFLRFRVEDLHLPSAVCPSVI